MNLFSDDLQIDRSDDAEQQRSEGDGRPKSARRSGREKRIDNADVVVSDEADNQNRQHENHGVQGDGEQLVGSRHLRGPIADEQQVLEFFGVFLDE